MAKAGEVSETPAAVACDRLIPHPGELRFSGLTEASRDLSCMQIPMRDRAVSGRWRMRVVVDTASRAKAARWRSGPCYQEEISKRRHSAAKRSWGGLRGFRSPPPPARELLQPGSLSTCPMFNRGNGFANMEVRLNCNRPHQHGHRAEFAGRPLGAIPNSPRNDELDGRHQMAIGRFEGQSHLFSIAGRKTAFGAAMLLLRMKYVETFARIVATSEYRSGNVKKCVHEITEEYLGTYEATFDAEPFPLSQ